MDMNEGKVGEKLGRALDDAQLVKYDIETGDCVAMWTGEHQDIS